MGELFPNGLKGVVFDCDGVMIDSNAANVEFYNRIMRHFGRASMSEEEKRQSCMLTCGQALEMLLPAELHGEIPKCGRSIVNYRHEIMPLVKIFDGFLDFTAKLAEKNIRMAILTNRTDQGIADVLDICGMPSYFNPIVTASFGFPKPKSGGARHILSSWGVAPYDVLYVGDSDVDWATAVAAQMPFAAMLSEWHEGLLGNFRVHGYSELFERIAPYLPD